MPLFGPPNVERLKDKGNVKGLIRALHYEKDWNVPPAAVEALGQLGEPALAPLVATLQDASPQVRALAASALGRIGDAQATGPLQAALNDPDAAVRRGAAFALGELGDRRAVPGLIDRLTDQDSGVRARTAEALGKLGDRQAVLPLIDHLTDWDIDVIVMAAWALGQIGDPQAVEELTHSLHGDERVRQAAIKALEQIREPSVPALIALLGDRNRGVSAAEALVRLGGWSVGPLIAALQDNPDNSSGAEVLGRIGDPRAVEPLIAALKSRRGITRFNVVTALESIGDTRAVEPLIELLAEEQDPRICQALGTLTGRHWNDFGLDAERWREWWQREK